MSMTATYEPIANDIPAPTAAKLVSRYSRKQVVPLFFILLIVSKNAFGQPLYEQEDVACDSSNQKKEAHHRSPSLQK